VILNGGDSYWDQSISLMEYGFNDFAHVEFAYSGQPLAEAHKYRALVEHAKPTTAK
jgi:hypothetical protein